MRHTWASWHVQAGTLWHVLCQHSKAGALQVFIRTNPFKENGPQYQAGFTVPLTEFSYDTRILVTAALVGLEQIYRPDFKYQKAGVMPLKLDADRVRQATLFDEPAPAEDADRTALMSTLDAVNRRMGKGALRLAGEGYAKRWKVKAERKSPGYTTRWDEMAVALAR